MSKINFKNILTEEELGGIMKESCLKFIYLFENGRRMFEYSKEPTEEELNFEICRFSLTYNLLNGGSNYFQ